VLAAIEIHAGNRDAAIAAATPLPTRLRWLGAPEPEPPPYDASKHEPIEGIPIESQDD
jgi:hypothetical protein